jgi:hypothetical protein
MLTEDFQTANFKQTNQSLKKILETEGVTNVKQYQSISSSSESAEECEVKDMYSNFND